MNTKGLFLVWQSSCFNICTFNSEVKLTMIRRTWLLYSLFLILASNCFSQKVSQWYFGENAGLDFGTSPPTVLLNGQSTNHDYTSVISDNSGKMLFYTDGMTVWNKLHAAMPNGSGLIGNLSAGQCALIIPLPNQPLKYVIFHTTEFSTPGHLHYSVVDMNLDGGLGDIDTAFKNISLGTGWTEKLCAYYNSSGNFYWLVAHKWNTAQFVSFKITTTTIATNFVTSTIGSIHNAGSYSSPHDAMGQLTISPDGSMIVNALTAQNKYELFSFDLNTGVLSNSVLIVGGGGKAWGAAFSPDSRKLYITSILGANLYQYDVSVYSANAINSSKFSVGTASAGGYSFGYLELGPDQKIYIARPNSSFLATIGNPDSSGTACHFTMNGQHLSGTCKWGLSRTAYNIPVQNLETGTKSLESNFGAPYPNPVRGLLQIPLDPINTCSTIEIMDHKGNFVSRIQINKRFIEEQNLTIDCNFLSSGFYFVLTTGTNGVNFFKVIKE